MGRKRRDEDQPPTQDETELDGQEHRSRRGRNLAVLLALAGGAVYLVRRNQRRAEIDEGIWHEAPAPAPASTTPTA
jgi:hypothetical protein